jgi:hypothetical protein
MSSVSNNLIAPLPSGAYYRPAVHIVEGQEKVLRLSETLMRFSERCCQRGSMHDLAYFLAKPGALPRVPILLLVGDAGLNLENLNLDDLLGAVLIFEHRVNGFRTGAYATNDRSGRGTLIARAPDRAGVAALTARALLDRGARLILMSFRATDEFGSAATIDPALLGRNGRVVAYWAQRERIIPGYLHLATSVDQTLAGVGTRTRRNLRYYRRRAEAELGCSFVPRVKCSREEMLAFSRESMYPSREEVAAWRYDSLQGLGDPVFVGIKDGAGRWLSMLGGRRYLDRSEILWQLNRDGLEAYSLGTVMRAYFIENEIAHGSRRLYAEGGTPHTIKFSFVPEKLTDLVVVRNTLAAKLIQKIAQHYVSQDNELSKMLSVEDLDWLPC